MMGREAREAKDARVAAVAEYERTVGPTLRFKERSECPKCEVPEAHLKRMWCAGVNPNDPPETLRRERELGSCPVEFEHLHVICPRCGYGWHEHCADDERNRQPLITT